MVPQTLETQTARGNPMISNLLHSISLRLAVVAVGVLMSCFIQSCTKEKPKTVRHEVRPNQHFEKAHIIVTDAGVTTAIIESDSIDIFEDRGFTIAKDSVFVELFTKQGLRSSVLYADVARMWGLYENVDSMKTAGNVKFLFYNDEGLHKATMWTNEAEVWMLSQEVDSLKATGDVLLHFYDNDGKHVSTLTAKIAELWATTGNADSLRASGDVVVDSEDSTQKATLYTPYMRWIAERDSVYADEDVRIVTESAVEKGTGFRAPSDFSSYQLENINSRVDIERAREQGERGGYEGF
jgi:predicted lipoprotein with Yx(FWY)xxD motif